VSESFPEIYFTASKPQGAICRSARLSGWWAMCSNTPVTRTWPISVEPLTSGFPQTPGCALQWSKLVFAEGDSGKRPPASRATDSARRGQCDSNSYELSDHRRFAGAYIQRPALPRRAVFISRAWPSAAAVGIYGSSRNPSRSNPRGSAAHGLGPAPADHRRVMNPGFCWRCWASRGIPAVAATVRFRNTCYGGCGDRSARFRGAPAILLLVAALASLAPARGFCAWTPRRRCATSSPHVHPTWRRRRSSPTRRRSRGALS